MNHVFNTLESIPHEELFPSEEKAVEALYEQLFDSLNDICKHTVLNAMKYLVYSKQMWNQIEEMEHMGPSDVCVLHHREVDRGVTQATKEMKDKLYALIDDYS